MLPPPFENALVLTGPTASGKTALALELAERLGAEIIAMDSMTLYRGMDVGTAKPTPEERARVSHHLIDVLDPWESANVAWWLARAGECCREIEARGKIALFVGGTPLYLKALLCGLFEAPPADEELRRRLTDEAGRLGPAALHTRLAEVDAATAARLHPNDLKRVVRALEVWELTGTPISAWQRQWDSRGGSTSAPDPSCVILDVPRDELHRRINARVRDMIGAGWVEEVRRLRGLPRPLSREAAQAVGYTELGEYLDGKLTLAEAVERIRARTRQFAKHQLTWFRKMPGCLFCTAELTSSLWQSRMKP